MKTRQLLFILALVVLAIAPAMAVTCPPSSPWPPAAGPIVKTVPWVVPQAPACLITPHDTISGSSIYVKATTNTTAAQYYWDFGDGTHTTWAPVSNMYNIGAQHTYTGAVGTSFTATVFVKDNSVPPITNSAKYYVTIRASNLPVRVNMAIDQALWRLHRNMSRTPGSGEGMHGNWSSGNYTGSGYYGNYAANTTAFLVNGHKPDSDPANPNPYAETVLRGINGTLVGIHTDSTPASKSTSRGTFKPDGNNNGLNIYTAQSDMYQGGMVMDMLVATGLPDRIAANGGSGIIGSTYKNIVQDMMDRYTKCQTNGYGGHNGGWRYGCDYSSSDNSVCQWAAIGMMAAVDSFGLAYPRPIPDLGGPSPVLLNNMDWLNYSKRDDGMFGYDSPGYAPWGWNAITPSGLVQLAMTGQGRGTPGNRTQWDRTENWLRANFAGPLSYYYGLFSFTKAMLLYPGGKLTQLCGRDAGNNLINCIDWYSAETPTSPMNGVARTLVDSQNADGYWWGHDPDGTQNYFETAWATIMLNKTVYASGLPIAVIDATPTQVINDGTVNLTGKNSFHQDATKSIVAWDWDVSGTGSGPFSLSGVNQNNVLVHTASATFPANFPIRLRVTDNNGQTAISMVTIVITNPPFPPTASAGGPYSVCPQPAYLPFYVDGRASNFAPGHLAGTTNPDNFITEYAWDLLGSGTYGTYSPQAQPRVDDFYSAQGLLGSGSTILVGLRVTDNSKISFGAADNLKGFATATVYLRTAADQLCTKCVKNATAVPHGTVPGTPGYIQLVWTETGAHHYNIFRATTNGGPYTLIGTVSNTVIGTNKSMGYADKSGLAAGTAYYYRIAPATAADIETCQSNQASASGTLPKGR
jgi:hypothetical protein